jgi:PKD repeat protein
MAPFRPMPRIFQLWLSAILIASLFVLRGASAQQTGVNFYVTAGREASPSEGDSLYRSVFLIECTPSVKGPLFLRVFDADIGGRYDQNVTPSKARYRLFTGRDSGAAILSINDPAPAAAPIIDLVLGEDNLYDSQWRTLASFEAPKADSRDSVSTFQLIIDGFSGKSVNLYQVFISSEDKRNTPVEGIRMTAPVTDVLITASGRGVTQIPFFIPRNLKAIVVHNFDAEVMGELFVQSVFREKLPVCVSGNGSSCSSRIQIQENELGTRAALIIAGIRTQADYVQCWITDEAGNILPFFLPPTVSPMNRLPVPRFETVPLSDCLSFVLDASASSDPDGDEISYKWSVEGRDVGEGRRIVHRFPEPGRFTVQLSVRDNSGFPADTKRLAQTVRINSAPVAAFDAPTAAAPGEPLQFDGTRSGDVDGRIVQYLWDFGDGGKAAGGTIRHAYALAGRYRVVLRVRDDSQSPCNSGEKTATISVNSSPIPRIQVKRTAAVDEELRLDGSGSIDSDGEITRYSWDLGDGGSAEGVSVAHRYRTPGVYRVRLTVSDNAGAKNSAQETVAPVVINAPPVAAAKARSVVAAGEAADFDAAGSFDPDGRIIEYRWDLGDGTEKTGARIRHAYSKPGRYEARLAVRDNSDALNNWTEAPFSIRVNSPPVPDAGKDRVVNESAVLFDGGASTDADDAIIDYVWDFGDSRSGRGRQVRHTYALPGAYRVKLAVRDGSGTESAEQSASVMVTVNHPPVADAGRWRVVAAGEKMVLDASFSHDPDGEIVDYQWTLENGVVRTGKTVECAISVPGTYQALLTVRDDAGAEDEHSVDIVVNAKPAARIFPVDRSTPGQKITFDGTGSRDPDGEITEASWDFGDGSPVQSGMKTVHAYSNPGRYQVSLSVRDNSQASNSRDIATATVTVNHAPVPAADPEQRVCSQTVHFDGSRSMDGDSDPLLFSWNFGDNAAASGARVSHTYERPGAYPVRLIVDDGNGLANSRSEAFIKVCINSPPSVKILAPENVCAGETVLLDAGRSTDPDDDPLKYEWDFGDGTSGEGVNPVHVYRTGGTYRIRLSVTDNSGLPCNSSLVETIIHVIDAPVAEAGPNLTVCANRPVLFDGSLSSGGSRPIQGYEWDFGDGQQGGGVKAVHTFAHAGLYTVRLKITVPLEGACENVSEDELTLKVLPSPVVSFNFSPIGCTGEAMLFDAGTSSTGDAANSRYVWDFGDSTSGDGIQTAHRYGRPGRYNVRLTLVTDAAQECNTAEWVRSVLINAKPIARAKLSAGRDGLPAVSPFSAVAFDASGSEDKDGTIRRYTWEFGDGGSAEGVFVRHAYKKSGDYRAMLVVEDESGSPCDLDTTVLNLTVTGVTPPWTIVGPDNACLNESVSFVLHEPGTGSAVTSPVVWFLNGGDTVKGNPVTRSFRDPGRYQIQALSQGIWSESHNFSAAALPSVLLPSSLDVDVNETLEIKPVTFGRDSLPVAYRWDWGDGSAADQPQARHAYRSPGKYKAVLTLRHPGRLSCPSDSHEVVVTVFGEPEISIAVSPDTLYSGGARDEVSFKAVSADPSRNMEFLWDFGDGQAAAGRSVSHAFGRPGTFSIRLTAQDVSRRAGRRFSFEKRIVVLPR